MSPEQRRVWLELVRLHEISQRAMDEAEQATVARIARLVEQVTRTMLEELAQHPDRVTDQVVRAVARIFDRGLVAGVAQLAELAATAYDIGVGLASSTIPQFGRVSRQKIEAIANALDASFRPQLLTEGRARWYGRLRDEVMRPQSALMRALIDARAMGHSLGDAARKLLELDPTLSELPDTNRQIKASVRALMVVRTESNRILNTAGVLFNEQAGIKNFRNFGIGDERQADTCWLASLAKPMTIEAWAKYEAGPADRPVPWQKRVKVRHLERQFVGAPGRHPNCRCQAVGVPAAFVPSVELLERAGLIPAAA